jgi:hypothetical protein
MFTFEFSVERPFGIYLFDYFDQLYTMIVGQSAKDFHFVQGVTPLSTLHEGKFLLFLCIFYTKQTLNYSDNWLYYLFYCYLWRTILAL